MPGKNVRIILDEGNRVPVPPARPAPVQVDLTKGYVVPKPPQPQPTKKSK